jgi:Fur family peroxide stress response transcriptional regulator
VSAEQNRLEEIVTKLRQRDFRITPQRIAILKAFLQSSDHPGIDQVYEEVKINFPTTSLATVYKTVKLLKDEGEILEINLGDGANRYDGNKPYPHPHLICTRCQKITDPAVNLLDKMAAELASSSGYRIESHQVEFFGVCPECQKK